MMGCYFKFEKILLLKIDVMFPLNFGATALSIMTFSIMTLSIFTFSIMTLSIIDTQHN